MSGLCNPSSAPLFLRLTFTAVASLPPSPRRSRRCQHDGEQDQKRGVLSQLNHHRLRSLTAPPISAEPGVGAAPSRLHIRKRCSCRDIPPRPILFGLPPHRRRVRFLHLDPALAAFFDGRFDINSSYAQRHKKLFILQISADGFRLIAGSNHIIFRHIRQRLRVSAIKRMFVAKSDTATLCAQTNITSYDGFSEFVPTLTISFQN
jgi:hypothetical protein